MTRECPSPERLQSYLLGNVSAEEMDTLTSHLDECDSCAGELERIHHHAPNHLRRLRDAARLPSANDPVVEQVVRQVRERPPGDFTVDAPSLPFELKGRLHEYQILGKIGEGGMGQVYKALHTRLGKTVALKILTRRRGHDRAAIERFDREMKAVGKLAHPHIVQALDASEVEGLPYLVMEYVAGQNLTDLVRRLGPLRSSDACEIIRQAALGLAHAHGQGLIHRDIKPSNILLTPEGQLKILDLGLALLKTEPPLDAHSDTEPMLSNTAAGEPLTSEGSVLGTNDYMAPEQWHDPHGVGPAADLYSLGCTLFYLLTGRGPFAEEGVTSLAAKRQAHAQRKPPSPRSLRPELPPALDGIVARLLAKAPADRFPNAQAVAHALKPLAVHNELPSLVSGQPRPAPRRRPRQWILVAACLALFLVLVVAGVIRLMPGPVAMTSNVDVKPPSSPVTIEPKKPPAPGALPLSPEEAVKLQTAWADYLGREPIEDNSLGMKLVLVPPGEFDIEPDKRMVISRPFWLGHCEVTRGQFRQFVAAAKHLTSAESAKASEWVSLVEPDAPGRNYSTNIQTRNGLNWQTPGYANPGDEDAVVHVSWDDAVAFCQWLSEKEGRGYRLPREAEWSWAHHAGDVADRPSGAPRGTVESVRARSLKPMRPGPVGQEAPNAWGLHDMSDNVSEWCRDWWLLALPPGRHLDYEYTTPLPNNIRTRRVHVRRGASFASVAFHYAQRLPNPGESTRSDLGFRVLREVTD